jgi:hypothetical protein
VTIDIEARGTGCDLTLTNEGVPAEWKEQSRDGWTGILASLDELLQ